MSSFQPLLDRLSYDSLPTLSIASDLRVRLNTPDPNAQDLRQWLQELMRDRSEAITRLQHLRNLEHSSHGPASRSERRAQQEVANSLQQHFAQIDIVIQDMDRSLPPGTTAHVSDGTRARLFGNLGGTRQRLSDLWASMTRAYATRVNSNASSSAPTHGQPPGGTYGRPPNGNNYWQTPSHQNTNTAGPSQPTSGLSSIFNGFFGKIMPQANGNHITGQTGASPGFFGGNNNNGQGAAQSPFLQALQGFQHVTGIASNIVGTGSSGLSAWYHYNQLTGDPAADAGAAMAAPAPYYDPAPAQPEPYPDQSQYDPYAYSAAPSTGYEQAPAQDAYQYDAAYQDDGQYHPAGNSGMYDPDEPGMGGPSGYDDGDGYDDGGGYDDGEA